MAIIVRSRIMVTLGRACRQLSEHHTESSSRSQRRLCTTTCSLSRRGGRKNVTNSWVPSNRSRTHGATKAQGPAVFAGEANAGVGLVDDLRPGRHVGGVGLGQEGVTQALEGWPTSRASPRWKTRSPSSGKALYRAGSLAVRSSLHAYSATNGCLRANRSRSKGSPSSTGIRRALSGS
jgi:hypothetical protein